MFHILGLRELRPRHVLLATLAWVGTAAAQAPMASPGSLGFERYYKCPSDADMTPLGDTITAQNCLNACRAQRRAAGCWWLDGSGGFPRECRACRTMRPVKEFWPNDWAMPLTTDVIARLGAWAAGSPPS